tara:strand:- start:218 stop:463 length:246 start_codon:yes stop_codon:yes gene_type:complete
MTKELYVAPKKDEKNDKEEFCPVCALAPLVVASAAGSTAAGTSKNKTKTKTIAMWIFAVIFTLGSIALFVYWYKGDCKTCK